ncbi:MAG: hypothetical protein ACI8R4_001736 [Paracoccaceae bacterium]|jgi:hypothetical protein
MFEAFLTTTSSEGLQPLGSAPQRSFELVTGTIRDRLGPDHAALFAEPVATEHGERIDWYAPVSGDAVALPDLAEVDQAKLRVTLGTRIAAIKAEADKLAISDTPEDQRLSEALGNAIEVPGEGMVYGVRDAGGVLHPVLVHWAWVGDEQTAVRGVLTGMVPRARPLASVGVGVVPVRSGVPAGAWWALIVLGWLLLAALLGGILYLMIAACGLRGGRLVFCPVDAPVLQAEIGEQRVIEDEIARLRRELALADRACKPTIPLTPSVPVLPVPSPEPKPKPKPAPKPIPVPAFPTAPAAPQQQGATEADRDASAQRITQRGARQGVLNFVLEWGSTDDVDLSVTCPTGAVISLRNRGDCNGTYDLDANKDPASAVTDPVENIVFDEARKGIYHVRTHLRENRTGGDIPITLHVLRKNGPSHSYSATLGPKQSEWTVNISISR